MEGILLNNDTNEKHTIDDEVTRVNLIKSAVKGSQGNFLMLINSYKSYLYKTAYLYVKNEQDALDIYQETVYKAYLNIKKLKKPQYFKTWITRILINNANDKLSSRESKNVFIDINECENISEDSISVSLEEKIDLYNAIDSLSEKYKTPIILNYFQSMTTKEISEILKCPENTVKSYIRRGKAILLKSLREDI